VDMSVASCPVGGVLGAPVPALKPVPPLLGALAVLA
jgi:hypothetical protein